MNKVFLIYSGKTPTKHNNNSIYSSNLGHKDVVLNVSLDMGGYICNFVN